VGLLSERGSPKKAEVGVCASKETVFIKETAQARRAVTETARERSSEKHQKKKASRKEKDPHLHDKKINKSTTQPRKKKAWQHTRRVSGESKEGGKNK